MKNLQDILRGARKIELLAIIISLSVLFLLWNGRHIDTHAGSELESRLGAILSEIEGVGSVSVMVTENGDGVVTGVLVVTEGAERMDVYLRVQCAVKTLLDVDISKIEIVKSA